jgi:hypothetical protein
MKKIKFNNGKNELIIYLTKHYIIKKICFYQNSLLKECLDDFFIISYEEVTRLKKILNHFDNKTQIKIKNFIKKFLD